MSRDTFVIYALAFVMVTGSACAGSDLPTETAIPDLQSQDVASTAGGDPARSADAFVNSIGVNVHISYLDRVYGSGFSTIIKPKVAKLGVRHLRDGGQVNSNNDWMRTIYGRMRELSDAGPKFTLIMAPQNGDYNKADHVARLVEYAGPAVEAFEGPNELDMRGGYWAPNLRAFQRALYTRVKNDPALRGYTVVGPSLGRAGRASEIGNISASMDAASVHIYAGGDVPMAPVNYTLTASAAMNGSKPVWVTETGYHNATSSTDPHAAVSERAAGRYVPRMFLDYFAAGIARSYAYELIDQGANASKVEFSFGLLRVDGTEKPAYRALTNLIALLSDPGPAPTLSSLTYSLKGDTKDVRRLLLQKRDGTFYLLLWLDVPSYDLTRRTDINVASRNLTLELPSAFSSVRLFDPLVSQAATSTFTAANSVAVSVSDAPVVVELKR